MTLLALLALMCAYAGIVVGLTLADDTGAITVAASLLAGIVAVAWLLRRVPAPSSEGGRDRDERGYLGRLVFLGFAIRLLVSGVLHAGGWWGYMGGDEGTFHSNGLVFNAYLEGTYRYPLNPKFLDSPEVGFFYLVGGLYHVYGVEKLFPLLLTCGVGASLVYPVHAIASRWGGRMAGRRAALLVAFFPSLVLWSALMVRDSLALFFLATTILAADRLRLRLGFRWGVVLLVSLFALSTLRTYIFLIVAAAVAGSFVLGRRTVGKSVITGVVAMLALVLVIRATGIGRAELEKADLEKMAMLRQYNALGPSEAGSLGADVDISTPTAAVTYLPIGMAYFLLSPLPWQIGSPRQVMAIPDLLVWYAMLPAVIRGLAWLLRRRPRSVLALLLAVAGITVLYSLVEGNIGIIFRHRAQIIVPLTAVAGVGHMVAAREARRKESAAGEGALPFGAAAGGPLGAPAHLRLPPLAGAGGDRG